MRGQPVVHLTPTLRMNDPPSLERRRLRPVQARLLAALARSRAGSRDELVEALWPCPNCQPLNTRNAIAAFMTYLRIVMRDFGIGIVAYPRRGQYRLTGDIHVDWRGWRRPACRCASQQRRAA